MTRLLIIFILISWVGLSAHAQQYDQLHLVREEADRLFELERYFAAIDYYKELLTYETNDPDLDFKLAESYRKTFNYPRAEIHYRRAYLSGEYPIAQYYYALMLKLNGQCQMAEREFESFMEEYQDNSEFSRQVEQAAIDLAGCRMTSEMTQVPFNYEITRLAFPLNSPFNDFAIAPLDSNTIVLTSGRLTSKRDRLDERFGEAFTDNYLFVKEGGAWKDQTKEYFKGINTKNNDGGGCFNRGRDKYYFSICGANPPECRIYVTKKVEGKWLAPELLNENINLGGYEAKHPAISRGSDTLYFVSDRPGGLGLNDLWMSIDAGDDYWGPPINLGKGINTELNELAPATTTLSNTIFFASDGHQGYGGLDLYMTKWLSSGDTVIYNLGPAFNSSRDDVFPVADGQYFYWSSNKDDEHGFFDIYQATINSEMAFISKVVFQGNKASRNSVVTSRTNSFRRSDLYALSNTEQMSYQNLTYEEQLLVDQIIEDKIKNEADTVSSKYADYLYAIAEKRYHELQLQQTSMEAVLGEISTMIDSISVSTSSITGTIRTSSGKGASGIRLYLKDSLNEVLKITTSNESGHFRFTGVPGGMHLKIAMDPGQISQHSVYTLLNVAVHKKSEEHPVNFENIYFDFDHFELRSEARIVLNEMANYLKQNPHVQVEIYAHADGQGSEEYNLLLSKRRGEQVYQYLIKQGVDETGLLIIPKGNYSPLASNNNKIGRQLNRRVEFHFNGQQHSYQSSAKTILLKNDTDMEVISKAAGITLQELQTLNGRASDKLRAFEPVRIPLEADVPADLFISSEEL